MIRTIYYITGKQCSGKTLLVTRLKRAIEIPDIDRVAHWAPLKTYVRDIFVEKSGNLAFTAQDFSWSIHNRIKKESLKKGFKFININLERE